MRKFFILDTSVLVHDPNSLKHFHNSDVIIPITVLSELDKLKKQLNEAGKNARIASRILDEISGQGDISSGILIENDIKLIIDAKYRDCSKFKDLGDPNYGDTHILACALSYFDFFENEVILVSNDINLKIKARSKGLKAQSHENVKTSLNELYSGVSTIYNEEAGSQLLQFGWLDPNQYNFDLNINEYVVFKNQENTISIGQKISNNKIRLVKKNYPWGIAPKNQEQILAIDLIMNKNIDLVTLTGIAGCGKTLVALAAAIELVLARKEYERLVIYRPIQEVGNGVGYLPGSIQEKLEPWFQAIMDNLEVLFSSKGNGGDWRRNLELFQKKGQIEMEAITYIRGRSIPNSIILLDESQNLCPEDVKTILTRAGENTKVILTGDIEQIDNSSLDAMNNGLTNVIERFKNCEIAGHITLTKGERSRLATKAAEIL